MILPVAMALKSAHGWPVALLAACAVPLVFWFYLGRCRASGSQRCGWLATLRALTIALVGLAALQPTVSAPVAAHDRPRLVILVDDSLSMGTIDPWPSVAERVRIADGVGLLPPGVRGDPVAPLRAGLADLRGQLELIDEVQEEIDYARLIGRDTSTQEARLRLLIDEGTEGIGRLLDLATRDPRLRRAAERLRSLPAIDPDRPEQVVRGLEQVEQALRAIADDADAELVARDPRASDAVARVASSSRLQLAALAIEQPDRGLRARLSTRFDVVVRTLSGAPWTPTTSPAGVTDLPAAVTRVRDEQVPPPAGVLLLSDGRQTEPETTIASSTPIWAVRIGSPSPRRDAALARVSLPGSSRPGQPLLIRGVLRLVSPRDESATLRASHVEGSTTGSVRIPANARQATVELSLPAPTSVAGAFPVIVELDSSGDDATRDNNRGVFVVEQRPPVGLMLAGSLARRDVRCLDVWLDQPSYRVSRVVQGNAGQPVELNAASLRDVRTLILADLGPDDLSASTWRGIEQAVQRDGLTVVLFCGDPTLLRAMGRSEASRWLLPVETPEAVGWRTWSGESPGFRVIADRRHGDRAAIDVEPAESRRRWLAAPRFFRFLSLATLPADGETWLREIDSQAPLLASWRHGRGEIRWLGLTETWRWRDADVGEDVQGALFRALVEPPEGDPRNASLGQASADENGRLRELADLTANPTGLSRLVRSGPGTTLSLPELSSLVDRLLAEPPAPARHREVPLWSTWSWLGLCVGALTLEWSLRKRMGLV